MPIEPDLLSARQTAWPERYKRADTHGCKPHTEQASGKSQHRALGEALAHQAAAARTERSAHGEFALARDCASNKQAGHIDARNQHHQADRAQEQPERGPDISHIRTKRMGDEGAACIGFWVLLSQIRLRLGQRQAGPKACQNLNARMPVAIPHTRRSVLTERSKHVHLVSVHPETCGRDADNGEGLSIHHQRLPDRSRVPREEALP